MADEKVIIELDLVMPDGTIQKASAKVERGMMAGGKKAGKAFGSTFSSTVSSFLGNVGAIAFTRAMAGIKNSIGDVVSAASKLEVFETQFKTMLKSTEAAKKQLKDLQQFAATTPFQLEGLAVSTRQLLSFGVAQEQIIPTLQQIGDLAAGVGVAIDDLTIPYGRLRSTQKLTLIELDKFADKGINLYQSLSDQTGVSLKNIRDEISKGKISYDEFTKALNGLTEEGGLFYKAMEAQSKTLSGTMSTLSDNVIRLEGALGAAFKDELIRAAAKFTGIVQDLTDNVIKNGPIIERKLGKAFDFLFLTPVKFWLDFFGGDTTTNLSKVAEDMRNVDAEIKKVEDRIKMFESQTGFAKFANSGIIGKSALEQERETLGKLILDASNLKALQTDLLNATADAEGGMFVGPMPQAVDDIKPDETLADPFMNLSMATDSFFDGFAPKAETFKMSLAEMQKSMVDFGKKTREAMIGGFAGAVSGGFAAFGKALASGENALDAFMKAFLSSIGQMAIQQGAAFILQGIGYQFVPGMQAVGSGLIAAGAAMATFGGALSAFSGGGTSASGGGSAETSGVASVDQTTLTDQTFDDEDIREARTEVNLTVQGNVLDSEESGLELVRIINSAIDSSNVTINQSFA